MPVFEMAQLDQVITTQVGLTPVTAVAVHSR
jgi:hypothetical protein